MPALFIFLLKVNVALLLFCGGYYLVLRHLTFYTLNRIYLIIAILFSSIYPQFNLSGFAERHQQLSKPVQAVVLNWQSPAETFIRPVAPINYWYWAEVIFWTGAALLAARLLVQMYSLYRLYHNSKTSLIFGHQVRVVESGSGPFSFWKSIYLNPANHTPEDLKAILLHEQVHINEWHTLDILLAELSTIFYWFNPGVWLMKKAVRENIEFITDRKILNTGIDTKQYQYSLVNVSFNTSSPGIVNHFNISTIKKRIIMMNAKRSSKFNLTRYAFLIPAVVVLLLVFSISKAALHKKISNANTTVMAKVKTGNIIGYKNNSQTILPVLNKKGNRIAAKTLDTIQKGGVSVITSHHPDSLTYVINGIRASKEDFKAIDPDRMYSIEILSAERAKKIISLPDDNNVLFVTTNDSEAGKKFKEKIDNVKNIVRVKSMSVNGISYTLKGNSTDTIIFDTVGAKSIWNRARQRAIYVKGSQNLSFGKGKVVIIGNDSLRNRFRDSDSAMTFSFRGRIRKNDTLFLGKLSRLKKQEDSIFLFKNRTYAFAPKALTINGLKFNNETSINHLSEKMIMIDGKEATERDLKKLSAADIEDVMVKLGEDMTKKYGDKAKNGVLFITTKKDGK